jgi:two-component system nitrate/nitrite response regulator NarL
MPPKPKKGEDLTNRELEVIQLITNEGISNKQIADRLGISDGTAKFHVGNACFKLGTNSRVRAAVIFALRRAA